MALDLYQFPVTTPTNSWQPEQNSLIDRLRNQLDEGIIKRLTSGKARKLYETGIRVRILTRFYYMESTTSLNNYYVFRDTVAGQKFKFVDHDGVAHTVTFDDFTRDPEPLNGVGVVWSWLVVMREEL